MKIEFRRKNKPRTLYTYGNSLIISMGLILAISSVITPSIGFAIIVILLTFFLL